MKKNSMKFAVTALVAATLAACGGGDTAGPKVNTSNIIVFGDSLADSGTFGFKFTVQGADAKIWPELVAGTFGIGICNHYAATSQTTFAVNGDGKCTNHSIGGGRINNATNPASPVSIIRQMQDRAALGYTAGDLVLIDGGGNDAADLIGAFLQAGASAQGAANYQALLGTLLPSAVLANVLQQENGAALAGGLYMQALADRFVSELNTLVIDKGATRTVILNMPPVALTPRFQTLLGGIAQSQGSATRDLVATLADTWVRTFNDRLAANLAGNRKVAVTDFYTDFKNQFTTPAQFGLTNVTDTVCPITGVGSDQLPVHDWASCTVTNIESGKTAGWWTRYAFSDGFHPTPYGHQLISQSVSITLAKAGWL